MVQLQASHSSGEIVAPQSPGPHPGISCLSAVCGRDRVRYCLPKVCLARFPFPPVLLPVGLVTLR